MKLPSDEILEKILMLALTFMCMSFGVMIIVMIILTVTHSL